MVTVTTGVLHRGFIVPSCSSCPSGCAAGAVACRPGRRLVYRIVRKDSSPTVLFVVDRACRLHARRAESPFRRHLRASGPSRVIGNALCCLPAHAAETPRTPTSAPIASARSKRRTRQSSGLAVRLRRWSPTSGACSCVALRPVSRGVCVRYSRSWPRYWRRPRRSRPDSNRRQLRRHRRPSSPPRQRRQRRPSCRPGRIAPTN